ncbi:MAG: hypothetical protein WA624_05875, partial [Methylocella sp.]
MPWIFGETLTLRPCFPARTGWFAADCCFQNRFPSPHHAPRRGVAASREHDLEKLSECLEKIMQEKRSRRRTIKLDGIIVNDILALS